MSTTTFDHPLRASTWLAGLLLAGVVGLLAQRESLTAIAAPAAYPGLIRHLLLGLTMVAWLLGAFLFNRLAGYVLWDLVLARTLRRPMPGALKALGAICILLVTVTCIVGLVFDRSITGFLAALGAGSFALGLALRNLIADIFTGLAVNLDGTFRIGDWIEVNDNTGATVGEIEEIGWRSTRLRTEDQKTVVIPNSYLGINRITNVSRPVPATRFQVGVTLDFSVPVARAKRIFLASLHAVHDVPGFVQEREPEVLAAEATERGLEYHLRFWIIPWTGISPNRARDLVTTSAMEHLRTAGIAPAYEKTDIYHRDMPLRNWEGHTREEQVALLGRLDLFSRLERSEIDALADAAERRTFHSGAVLFAQGDTGDSLLVLTEGLLDVSIAANGNGSRQRVGRVLPGEFVGEMSLLTGEPRSATVTAVTPGVAYEIAGESLRQLVGSRPEIARMLSEVLAARRLRNVETERRHGEGAHAEEAASFASQLLTRILSFLRAG